MDIKTTVDVIQETPWKRALNAARRTIGKEPIDKEPSDNWKASVLLAEHSPIKLVEYLISYKGLRQWVGVHLLRHGFMLPFIHSQREDRRKLDCEIIEEAKETGIEYTEEQINKIAEKRVKKEIMHLCVKGNERGLANGKR